MSDVMTFSKRTAAGLEEVLRTLLLDSENKIPSDRLRIVGALAEGAIIEQGSNANGEYTRFASGLQICRGTIYYNGLNTAEKYNSVSFTFPAVFVGEATVTALATSFPGAAGTFITGTATTIGAQVNFLCFDGARPSVTNLTFRWLVIGKWK